MVSRRNFFAITTMMLVICFLFMLPMQMKEASNPYSQNSYAVASDAPGQDSVWSQPVQQTAPLSELTQQQKETLAKENFFALYVGAYEDDTSYSVKSWAEYTKTALVCFSSVTDYAQSGARCPDLVILEPEACDFETELETLKKWNAEGTVMIFTALPDVLQLNANADLRALLGVREVKAEHVELEAVRMFDGFLLGGERIYGLETEQDRELMNLNLATPWLTLQSGTEVYLMGELSEEILPEQEYRNELLPALIWRNSANGTSVFTVNGDYLCGNTGIGILTALMAKHQTYYLYPVVNSQVLTVANFPSMANENDEELTRRYGKGQQAVVRDLFWPSLESMSEIYGFRLSCFELPQYNFSDNIEPTSEQISYYLKLLRELNSEAGISLYHNDSVSLQDKWARDKGFLSSDVSTYRYSSAYATDNELSEISNLGELMAEIMTVSVNTQDNMLFDYLDRNTLGQAVTHDLMNYSFTEDLELRSLETALGYSNILLDMQEVIWPKQEKPGWEVYYEMVASNLHTYWRKYDCFDHLTISESDARVRNFLGMDFAQQRQDDVISVDIASADQNNDFILRTHMEDVSEVTGGSFRKLEDDCWLIHAEQPHVEISIVRNETFYF